MQNQDTLKKPIDERLLAFLNGLIGIGIILISFLVELRFPDKMLNWKTIGLIILYAGMSLFIWATLHLKGAIRGFVKPQSDILVKSGPYRFMRHPVYLGITIALIGVVIILRSWPGILCVLLIFLPAELYRAKLEDNALRGRFREEWVRYAKRTRFLLPYFGRK